MNGTRFIGTDEEAHLINFERVLCMSQTEHGGTKRLKVVFGDAAFLMVQEADQQRVINDFNRYLSDLTAEASKSETTSNTRRNRATNRSTKSAAAE